MIATVEEGSGVVAWEGDCLEVFDNKCRLLMNRVKNVSVGLYDAPADLEVSGIDFTTPPVVGERTTAVARIVNQSDTITGPFSVGWFLDYKRVLLDYYTFLAPRQVIDAHFDWTPQADGNTLTVVADVFRQIRESNESNNNATTKVSFLPDLLVGEIEFPSPPAAGVPTVATIQLANQGLTAANPFVVRWYQDHNASHPVFFTELGPGQTATVSFNWTPTAGWHRLRVMADADRQVREAVEHNNGAAVALRIEEAAALADLEATEISFTSPPVVGKQTTVVARLANIGQAASGPFNVIWHLDGEEVGLGSHVSLDSGQISNDNVRYEWTPTPNEHLLMFIADVDARVQELDEMNNCVHVFVEPQ